LDRRIIAPMILRPWSAVHQQDQRPRSGLAQGDREQSMDGEPVARGKRHRLRGRQLIAIRSDRGLRERLGLPGCAVEKVDGLAAAIGLDRECQPATLAIFAENVQRAAFTREEAREIGLQKRIVETPFLKSRPGPDEAQGTGPYYPPAV